MFILNPKVALCSDEIVRWLVAITQLPSENPMHALVPVDTGWQKLPRHRLPLIIN